MLTKGSNMDFDCIRNEMINIIFLIFSRVHKLTS